MKKFIALALLLISTVSLTGCGKIGTGTTTGYVYAVDDSLFWDKVWFKTSLQSAESDCYLLDNDSLKEQLKGIISAKKIKLNYDRQIFSLGGCGDSNDAITSFEEVTETK